MIDRNLISFRRRFVKDYNLPINVVDSPFFEYYMETYDWFPKKEYNELLADIDNRFQGNLNLWLEEYAEIRDDIITTLENLDAYKDFNSRDMKEWEVPKEMRSFPDMNIYNQSSVGKTFVSIDLKKANFQALRFVNPDIVLEAETYEEFIDKFIGYESEYFRTSKYTRQVIFGKLNPKRTITVEKFIMSKIYAFLMEDIMNITSEYDAKLVAFKSDELIFEVNSENPAVGTQPLFDYWKTQIKEKFDIDVHIDLFKVGRIETRNHNDVIVDCYIRTNLLTGEETLKSCSQIFYPQFYKIWKGKEEDIRDYDLVFLAEGQLATFTYPLNLVGIY